MINRTCCITNTQKVNTQDKYNSKFASHLMKSDHLPVKIKNSIKILHFSGNYSYFKRFEICNGLQLNNEFILNDIIPTKQNLCTFYFIPSLVMTSVGNALNGFNKSFNMQLIFWYFKSIFVVFQCIVHVFLIVFVYFKFYIFQSCSRAIGICARNHLELVLLKVGKLRKEELSRKSYRLLSFRRDVKHEDEKGRVRLTLLLCYSEVALEAPATKLLPQIEDITEWVRQQLQTTKVLTLLF